MVTSILIRTLNEHRGASPNSPLGSGASVAKEGGGRKEWLQVRGPLSLHFSICEMGEHTGAMKSPHPVWRRWKFPVGAGSMWA